MEKNTTDRIWHLMARKLSKEATDAELQELGLLMNSRNDEPHSLEIMELLWTTPPNEDKQPSELKYKELIRKMHDNGIDIQHFKNEEEGYMVSIEKGGKAGFLPFTTRSLRIAAAILGVILITGVFFSKNTSLRAKENRPIAQTSEISTHNGSKTNLTLPDGTKVWLNGGSKLTYESSFGNTYREVSLSGEAFFDVTKNPQKPFIIHTSKMDIRVLGTAFNVKCYPDEKKFETSLIRGSIEVTLKDRPTEKVYLKPNEKLTLINDEIVADKKENIAEKKQSIPLIAEPMVAIGYITHQPDDNSVIETSWVENKLVFIGETFEEVGLKMERWYGVNISIADEKLKKEHLTGSFEKETIDQALDALQITTSFKYTINKDKITITK